MVGLAYSLETAKTLKEEEVQNNMTFDKTINKFKRKVTAKEWELIQIMPKGIGYASSGKKKIGKKGAWEKKVKLD